MLSQLVALGVSPSRKDLTISGVDRFHGSSCEAEEQKLLLRPCAALAEGKQEGAGVGFGRDAYSHKFFEASEIRLRVGSTNAITEVMFNGKSTKIYTIKRFGLEAFLFEMSRIF